MIGLLIRAVAVIAMAARSPAVRRSVVAASKKVAEKSRSAVRWVVQKCQKSSPRKPPLKAKPSGSDVIGTRARVTRSGDKAVEIKRADGSIKDISPKRVKEFIPNNHPNAPPGAMNKVKFKDALPGSKGFKRAPTQDELKILREHK